MTHRKTALVVRIDALIVHGVDRRTAVRLGAALETELARLLADDGVPAGLRRGAEVAVLTLPDLRSRSGVGPATLGTDVAAALHQGLGSDAHPPATPVVERP